MRNEVEIRGLAQAFSACVRDDERRQNANERMRTAERIAGVLAWVLGGEDCVLTAMAALENREVSATTKPLGRMMR
jgi:hypothetical protein